MTLTLAFLCGILVGTVATVASMFSIVRREFPGVRLTR